MFAISELLDKQAATDKPWLPSLKAPLLYGENGRGNIRVNGEYRAAVPSGGIFVRAAANNGRRGIEEYRKLLVCFSPTES